MKKNLILIPGDNARGGITNYYKVLRNKLGTEFIFLKRGARKFPYTGSKLQVALRLMADIIIFILHLIFKNINIVQTTTSLTPKSVKRDGIYILLAKLFRKKVIVYFRGWNIELSTKLKNNLKFKKIFFKADAHIVLSQAAFDYLKAEGYKGKIFLETTLVEDEMIEGIDEKFISQKYLNSPKELLFLARLEKEKGIYEAIDAFGIVFNRFPQLHFSIAGDGTEEDNVIEYVKHKGLENISFHGFVQGSVKIELLKKAHLYIFPSYSEGMPNSVLEAMAMGIPVITSAVGGLVDFFIDGTHGYMVDIGKPEVYAKHISQLLENKNQMIEIGQKNHLYAKSRFLASSVKQRMIHIFNVVNNDN